MKNIKLNRNDRPIHNSNILISNQKLDMPWPGMVDFDILGYTDGRQLHTVFTDETSFVRANQVLLLLYYNVLIDDPLWHFIWEGSFVVILISAKNKKKVEAFFKQFHIKYHFKGVYGKDGQLSTERYQKVFTYIYHGFSVLAMEDTCHTAYATLDRVYHIFNCSNIYNFTAELKEYGAKWEPMIISKNAIARALYIGSSHLTQPDPPPKYGTTTNKKAADKNKKKR